MSNMLQNDFPICIEIITKITKKEGFLFLDRTWTIHSDKKVYIPFEVSSQRFHGSIF